MSSTHQSAESANAIERAPDAAGMGWVRVVVLGALAIAAIVVIWSLLQGADRDLFTRPATLLLATAPLNIS